MSSDGTPWRPFVHVLDIANAVGMHARRRRASRSTTRSSTSARTTQNHQIRQIAEIIGDLVPGCSLQFGDSERRQAQLPRRLRQDHRDSCPGSGCDVGRRAGRRGAARRSSTGSGSTRSCTAFRGHTRIAQIRHLLDTGQIDDDFFWLADESSRRPSRRADRAVGRICSSVLSLGSTPIANALVDPAHATDADPTYPLAIVFCADVRARPARLRAAGRPRSSTRTYPYFSSFSDALCAPRRRARRRRSIAGRRLGPESFAVEVAQQRRLPAAQLRRRRHPHARHRPVARTGRGGRGDRRADDRRLLRRRAGRAAIRAEHGPADVIIANNVMAHVPDLNDFVGGFAVLLADDGVLTVENPYVRDLVEHVEFDTIYHEHYCYFSCSSVDALMAPPRPAPQRRRVLPRPARRHAPLAHRASDRPHRPLPAHARRRGGRRASTARLLRALRRPGAARARTRCARCSTSSRPRVAPSPPTAPPPRERRCSTPPASATDLDRLRRRPQRAQAGQADARLPAADPAGRGAARGSVPTTCCCWRGTSPTRSSPSSASTRRPAGRSTCRCRCRVAISALTVGR